MWSEWLNQRWVIRVTHGFIALRIEIMVCLKIKMMKEMNLDYEQTSGNQNFFEYVRILERNYLCESFNLIEPIETSVSYTPSIVNNFIWFNLIPFHMLLCYVTSGVRNTKNLNQNKFSEGSMLIGISCRRINWTASYNVNWK